MNLTSMPLDCGGKPENPEKKNMQNPHRETLTWNWTQDSAESC